MQAELLHILTTKRDLEKDYIELIIPFTSPIDIYIRLEDLKTRAQFIYFFGYRMGKERIAFWGVFDSASNQLIVDSGCNDIKFQLAKLLKQWSSMGYQHVGAQQQNKFSDRLRHYINYQGPKNYDVLIKELTLIAWARKELSDAELLERSYIKGDRQVRFTMDDAIDYEIKLKKDAEYNEQTPEFMLDIYERQLNPPLPYQSKGETQLGMPGRIIKSTRQSKMKQKKKQGAAWMYYPLITYEQYALLKTNIEVHRGTLKKSKYPYPAVSYQRFLDQIKEFGQGQDASYIQFLWDTQILPYEENLNFVTIDEGVLSQLTPQEYDHIVNIVGMMRQQLERTNVVGQFKSQLCPPDMDACKYTDPSEIPRGCELYYYGREIKYKEDRGNSGTQEAFTTLV